MASDEVKELLERIDFRLNSVEQKLGGAPRLAAEVATIEETMVLLQCSRSTVKRLLRNGRLTSCDYMESVRIPMRQILALTMFTEEPSAPAGPRRSHEAREARAEADALRATLHKGKPQKP